MTAPELLAELDRLGAVAFGIRDRLRIRPAEPVPAALVEAYGARRDELRALVPAREGSGRADHPPQASYVYLIAADYGTSDDRCALGWFEGHADPGPLCAVCRVGERCERLVPEGNDETALRAAVGQPGFTPTNTKQAIAADDWLDPDGLGLRVVSRLLGRDVWLVADDTIAEALERDVEAEGESNLVFTLAEVFAMEGVLAAEMQAIAKLKRTLAGTGLGGRIDSIARCEGAQ